MRDLNIKIPGYRGRPRVKQAPWVLRHCPESQRGLATRFFIFTGGIAYLTLFFATFFFIALAPFLIAMGHPDSAIAVKLRWLQAHFSHDTAIFIFALVPFSITFILIYAIMVFNYIRHDPSYKLNRPE